MAVTTWNTGPAAARYRMSAKRSKKKATSLKPKKRQASSQRSVKQQALNVGPIVKRQAWRFAVIGHKS